jgi:vitamin B12 transporter
MSKKLTSSALLLLGSLAVVNAQQKDSTLNVLDDVIVTATKQPQKQSTTGKVVTVITKAQIEKSGGRTVAQLLNEQAGVTVNGALNNAGNVQTVYMRGGSQGRVLILMDGIPVNDPSAINNEFDINLFSINDVERIEVCRGAQSTLYGSDAVAGVINIITIKPDAKKLFNLKTTLSGGNFGTVRGNFQVYGKQDKLSYSVRYAKLKTAGFSSAYDSTGIRNFDNDNYDGNVVNAQLMYQATPKLSFRTFAMYSQYKADIDAGVFADEKDYYINNNNFITGAGFNFKDGAVTLTGNYQYSHLNRTYRNDSAFKTGTIFENNHYYGKTQFAELYASIQMGSGFTLLQGADYRYSSYNQDYFVVTGFGPYSSKFRDTSLSQTSLYASLFFASANKRLNVEAGGRLNTHSRYGSNYTYTLNPSYAFNNHWRIFASVASGFKAPTLYQLSLNAKLLAEQSVNYEAGVQYQKGKINTRLVGFNRVIDNGIDYNYITFNYFNYVKQVVKGIEYEVVVRPTEKLNISANYTYLSATEKTQNRITVKDTVTYKYLLRRPAHNINVNAGLQITGKFFASVNAKYVSSRFDVGGYKKADVKLVDYFLMGAYAEYVHNQHIKVFADAQNISSKTFYDIRGYNAIPFMLNAGITVNW